MAACTDFQPPALVLDGLLPSDNSYDIPTLDLSLQGEIPLKTPVIPWGCIKRSTEIDGSWHFYTDDYRFNALLGHPDQLIRTGSRSAVEINISTYNDMPMAKGIMATYQIQAKVFMRRPYMFAHSEWFKPYVAGYYAHLRGLNEDKTYVLSNIDGLLDATLIPETV